MQAAFTQRGCDFSCSRARLTASTASRAPVSRGLVVVRAADEKPAEAAKAWPKISDIRAMSTAQIEEQVKETKKELIMLGIKKGTRQGEVKFHHFPLLKKKVAMMKTVVREREIADGIGKRDSRKMDKKKRLADMLW